MTKRKSASTGAAGATRGAADAETDAAAAAASAAPEQGPAGEAVDGEMVEMDLAQNIRDEDGTLYRAGRARLIPAALAERLKAPLNAPLTAPGAKAE